MARENDLDPKAADSMRERSVDLEHGLFELERRRSPRLSSPGITGRLPRETRVRLRDLSLSGAGFESEVPLSTSRHYKLTISTNGGPPLQRRGRLVWSHLCGTERGEDGQVRPIYRAGLMFEDQSVTASSDLFEFLSEHRPTSERLEGGSDFPVERTATRYRIEELEPLPLRSEYELLVRTLSLTGMLIETEVALAQGTIADLTLELPESEISVRGKIVSTSRSWDGERFVYSIAVQFIEMPADERSRLDQYLRNRLH